MPSDVLDSVGAGLIAGGALALILSLAEPAPPLPGVPALADPVPEQARRYRNGRAGSFVGGVFTLAGSLLLLIGSGAWTTSAPAAGSVLLLTWFVLAHEVRGDYQLVVATMEMQMRSQKGAHIRESLAAYVGHDRWHQRGRSYQFVPEPGSASDSPIQDPEAVLAIARARATWQWALAHPLGARWNGL